MIETLVGVPALIFVLVAIVINVVALGLVPEGRRPGSAMAWLLLIVILPVLGLLLFLLLGHTHVPRKRREEQRVAGDLIRTGLATMPPLAPSPDRPDWLDSAMALNRRLAWLPATQNNTAELYPDYEGSIQAKADLVRTAERYVHVEYFMICRDSTTEPFFEALLEVAARGVKVRVLFDHLSTFGLPGYKEMLATFDQAGIEWRAMLPIRPLKGQWRRPDLRNHRKIVVVDGRSGFVGSQNMIDSSYHNKKHEAAGRKWRELTTKVEGPAVLSMNLVFASDWFIETKERLKDYVQLETFPDGLGDLTSQIVPSGPGFPDENNLRLFNTLIYGAQERLSITSPYFVPDDSLLYAITTAAQRGVAVELFVCERGEQFMESHAQCSYYRFLLDAGVRIFFYPYPFVLHAKHFSVDDHTAVIGSSNMDIRSFNLDFEVSMMGTGGRFVAQMREVEDMYRSMSRELTAEEWKKRPLHKRWLDNVMRLTSAYM
ncbi:MAG: cardiolipin synthase [Microlunatus sp.]|nr:cardiolipin synthase [Microlunatus sp.]MDN5771369.1 cardiolipin synthase [Microlunatus sp.]